MMAVLEGRLDEVQRREFAIETCLGRGGFGEVYRATMRSTGGLDSTVAVKVLREGLDPASQAVQRLRDEGRLLARLDHPVILRVNDLVTLDGRVGLVTEYVEGEDLSGCFHADPPMSQRALVEAIGQVAGALDAAWSAPSPGGGQLELVHRDIKPSNIRISRHGHVKLLDFGIARSDALAREARTQTDLVVGSPHYLAPERFLDPAVRPEADVFALGLTLFEGLTGARYYADATVLMMSAQALEKGRFDEFRSDRLALLPAGLEPALKRLLLDTLEYEPEARPAAARLMMRCEGLTDLLGGDSLARWARRRAWPAAGEGESGPLEGRTLSEGGQVRPSAGGVGSTSSDTLATTVLRETTTGTRSRSASRGAAVVAGLMAALLVLTVLFTAAGGLAWAFWPGEPAPQPVSVAEPTSDEPPDVPVEKALLEEPTPEVEPGSEPSAERERAQALKKASVEAPARAPVSAPSPAPAPPVAEPEPVATGSVAVTGGVRVELSGPAGRVTVPGEVPVGSYTIEAFYNDRDGSPAGRIEVADGSVATIVCSARMQRCSLR